MRWSFLVQITCRCERSALPNRKRSYCCAGHRQRLRPWADGSALEVRAPSRGRLPAPGNRELVSRYGGGLPGSRVMRLDPLVFDDS